MSKTEEAWEKIGKAIDRLKPTQGVLGRNNARDELLKQMRVMRRALNEEFPRIRKAVRKRKAAVGRTEIERRMEARGMVRIQMSIRDKLRGEGIRVESRKIQDKRKNRSITLLFAPSWAPLVLAQLGRSGLAQYQKTKSRKQKDAIVAEAVLSKRAKVE